MRRGEIYLCDFGNPAGHESGFRRPALVITPETLNRHGTPVVIPITRTRRNYPTHVELAGALPVDSYAQCELIRAVAQNRLQRQVGAANPVQMSQISQVLHRMLLL